MPAEAHRETRPTTAHRPPTHTPTATGTETHPSRAVGGNVEGIPPVPAALPAVALSDELSATHSRAKQLERGGRPADIGRVTQQRAPAVTHFIQRRSGLLLSEWWSRPIVEASAGFLGSREGPAPPMGDVAVNLFSGPQGLKILKTSRHARWLGPP
ncbi:hypothetical protein B0H10DRAFT_2431531 [Mycena sp. CBHHK59/15]|nr:hypothetical protein B0H10DRAFT_2431531 [Mycena sp. CBHHK59/15]